MPFGALFSMLKALLDDFAGHNVDAAAALVEAAGRFLLRLPETETRMANMLEAPTCICSHCSQATCMGCCLLFKRGCSASSVAVQASEGRPANPAVQLQCGPAQACKQVAGLTAAARRAQVMMKLKNSRNLDARQSLLLESAFYAARPPERTAARRKQRPPLREYMRHLVHERLTHAELKQARLMMRN